MAHERGDLVAESSDQHRCRRTAFEPFLRDDLELSLYGRFVAQVERHAACLAVGDGDIRVTYSELEHWSHVIADRLATQGTGSGHRVILLLEQGAHAIAATLAALRSGVVYVPLDTGEPDIRLRALSDLIKASGVITDTSGAERVARLLPTMPVVLADPEPELPGSARPPHMAVSPDAPAYIYLTSGTTGQPKGVMDCQRNILHNVMRYTNALDIGPLDRASLVQSPAFSGAVSSMFAALLNGAAVFPYRIGGDGLDKLADWMLSEHITIYHSVPSILRRALSFADLLPDVRVVRLEGDRSYGQDMTMWRRHFRPGTVIANGLGTTETGLCRQFLVPVETELEDGLMPVGHQVDDMDVTIVDDEGRELPAGDVGQIAVSSAYLATGYWTDEKLTSSSFTPTRDTPGSRTYRTGDLGRLRSDGCLEYLGRRDGLAKVLGHRVQPAEIEAALASVPLVQAVAVRIVGSRRREGRIVAYIVSSSDLDVDRLRAEASARLPAQMRPSQYVSIDELPLGPNGKVDRTALPEPPAAWKGPMAAATGPLATLIAGIVAGVLEHPVGRDEDFFLAGGDSLAAVDLLLALERRLGRRLAPSLLLRAPTVASLTAELQSTPGPGAPLYAISSGGEGLPVVLVPSHSGHALSYARLARNLEATRPVWTVETAGADSKGTGWSVEALARRHVEVLRRSSLAGPHFLGGYCYGGVVAFEMAQQLIRAGEQVAGVYLIGVSPSDFPGMVSPEVAERWARSRAPLGMLHRATRFSAGLTTPSGREYVAARLFTRTGRVRETLSREGRARRRSRARRASGSRSIFHPYHAAPLSCHVSVILPAWSLSTYSNDPISLWDGLAADVMVHVVPGVERMMLSEPVVSKVAGILAQDPPGTNSRSSPRSIR